MGYHIVPKINLEPILLTPCQRGLTVKEIQYLLKIIKL